MEQRVMEFWYDIEAVPAPIAAVGSGLRDIALAAVEAVLSVDDLGHAIDAAREADKLRLRCQVMDFDAAEARVRGALSGTVWGAPREVLRYWDRLAVA